jgi:hypothetical protein
MKTPTSKYRVDQQFHLATAAMLFVLATSIVTTAMDTPAPRAAAASETPALVVSAKPAEAAPQRVVQIEPMVVRASRI